MYKLYKKAQIACIRPIMALDGESMQQVKTRVGCNCIFNGGIYTMSDRSIDSQVRIDNVNYGKYCTYGFSILGNTIYWASGYYDTAPYFIGEYGILIEDSKITNTLKDGNRNNVTERTAVGINSQGDFIVMLAIGKGKCNLDTLCKRMLDLGCTYAINLDGGGSTQGILSNDMQYISGRKVVWYVGIWLNKKTEIEGENKMKIAIDCGHTESTAGKRSPDGTLREYEFNRDVGNRIKSHLERHNIDVLLIAPTGNDNLTERCNIANKAKADYFVSIHANAFDTTWNVANGWEIYILSKGGQAEKLAKSIEKESIPYLELKNRGLKTSAFAVLKGTNMPAVLIEHAFYTNIDECNKLKSSLFREKCAIADAKGILKHLGIAWIEDVKEDINPNEPTQTSNWYDEACKWAKDMCIADGTRPTETATRAEIFTMLMRLYNKLAK